MKICFRVDASIKIGNGHIIRCLALARELRKRGAICHFVTRAHPGHQADRIAQEGFQVSLLAVPDGPEPAAPPDHAAWAGVPWEQDLAETRTASDHADWLIVDHYALDARWQQGMTDRVGRIMVIDDLADRPHVADLLLDQNLGRDANDYDSLVPAQCRRLIGPQFALLRPEFAVQRTASLARRDEAQLSHVMISMGGTDMVDATSQVLRALAEADLPNDLRISVIMGRTAPALERVRELAARMPLQTKIMVDVRDISALMADADLAIGAAGGTAWERCCVGLPSLMLTLAANQHDGAQSLHRCGAALLLGDVCDDDWKTRLTNILQNEDFSTTLSEMSLRARDVTDGHGCARVASEILRQGARARQQVQS